jgi:lipoprotein-anchoring transpeptidase ErfK/SrfK
MMNRWGLFVTALLTAGQMLSGTRADAAPLGRDAVNKARFTQSARSQAVSPVIVKAQVLLDRKNISPGVIDGRRGSNLKKALKAFQGLEKLKRTGSLNRETWQALGGSANVPALITYTLTSSDVKGPFVRKIPQEMKQKAKLKRLAFTSPVEMLAEKFHMGERLLKQLNPGRSFKKAGESLVVANVRGIKPDGKAAKIVVDKTGEAVKVYDRRGQVIAFYPATIGSADNPAPSGNLKVRSVAENPVFTYSAKLKYAKELKEGQKIKVPPGPNNPVGSVWIDLNKYGYGIHGTPEPSKISKTESHGCVRLTNWDAQELAGMVSAGMPAIFGG